MDGNQLFPVFLKLDKLNTLIVGAGEVGWEKLEKMFNHTTAVNIHLVAPEIKEEIEALQKEYPTQIKISQKEFEINDLDDVDIVIAATADEKLNRFVWEEAKKKGLIVNVADTPSLCDFYLSSVVKKGDLKIAISSNGKSPTLTKRMRELLEDALPEEIDDLLESLHEIRAQLKGDFEEKVTTLNSITYKFSNRKKS